MVEQVNNYLDFKAAVQRISMRREYNNGINNENSETFVSQVPLSKKA